jgi:cell wall-associated NlpC family hydrolase
MYAWVKKYIGIPFLSGGRTEEGCDCYGLCRLVLAAEYGVSLPGLPGDYADALRIRETAALFEKNIPVLAAGRLGGPEEGALAVMAERGRPCHLGIYAGGGYILHTKAATGAVCQRLSSPGLAGCIEGYYRAR